MIYMAGTMQTGGGLFINAPLLLSTILILCFEFKRVLDTNPNFPLLKVDSVKQNILKGAQISV